MIGVFNGVHILKNKWLNWSVILLGVIVAVACGVIVHQGWRLASPERRALQDYHASWLDTPNAHGVEISRLECCGGKVPTLIVEPSKSVSLGKRGLLLREQLQQKGIALGKHGEIIGNMVLLHGRNGRKEDLLPVAERFCAAGFRCVIPDLPAHGESPIKTVHFGALEWERKLPEAVLLEAASEMGFDASSSGLWGMSMGGSFATHAAAYDDWNSLTIVCSFDRLNHILEEQCEPLSNTIAASCQYFGGVDPTVVTPEEWSKRVQEPVLVLHGDADKLIPISLGRSLYESFASPDKRWITVEGGTHQSILVTPMPVYAEMVEWALRYNSSH